MVAPLGFCEIGKEGFENKNDNKSKNKKKRQKLAAIRKAMNKKMSDERIQKKSHPAPPISDSEDESDSDNDMADFNPPPKTESVGAMRTKERENKSANRLELNNNFQDDGHGENVDNQDDEEVSKEGFRKMSSNYAQQYYNQYIPFSNSNMASQSTINNADFMKKLNYMIHLLEDQKDEKVNGITEELVLYLFLGIFIIFLVDSFAKVGKYIR